MRYSLRLKSVLAAVMLTLSFVVAGRAQTHADSDPRAFIEKARKSMVLITAEKAAGETMALGVGFFVGSNLVATDLSVVISARRISIQPAGQEQKVDVLTYDNNRLVTILTVARAGGPPLTLGDSDKVALNDKVFLVEYSNNGALSEAMVTKLGTSADSRSFQISKPITSSNRGGPVFDTKGDVIGIASESITGQVIVMPVSYLATLLKKVTGPGGGVGIGVGQGAGVGPGLPSTGPGRGEFGGQSNSTAAATSVDVKPVLLKSVPPRYTEEARRNEVQGTVTMRIQIGEDGNVKQARITRGLPDGLNERAFEAVFQMKFKPAMKNGLPVPYWLGIQVEFNLK